MYDYDKHVIYDDMETSSWCTWVTLKFLWHMGFSMLPFAKGKTTYLSNGVFVIDRNIHRLIVGDLTIALCLESWILSFVWCSCHGIAIRCNRSTPMVKCIVQVPWSCRLSMNHKVIRLGELQQAHLASQKRFITQLRKWSIRSGGGDMWWWSIQDVTPMICWL